MTRRAKYLIPEYKELTPEQVAERKEWIDKASYYDLLQKWRFSASGDQMFQGELGKYYSDVMFRKKEEIGMEAAVQASKDLGWEA